MIVTALCSQTQTKNFLKVLLCNTFKKIFGLLAITPFAPKTSSAAQSAALLVFGF
ncbi:hypothetical protein HCU40_04055 [Pseudanabaena biceps]|nr:hypothetical protein [Pseudanabaena biceps]